MANSVRKYLESKGAKEERDFFKALEMGRWGTWLKYPKQKFVIKPKCPSCECSNVTEIRPKKMPILYQCNNKECRKQFNLFTGTDFCCTHIPLKIWFEAYLYWKRGYRGIELAKKIGLINKYAKMLEKKIDKIDLKTGGHLFKKSLRLLKIYGKHEKILCFHDTEDDTYTYYELYAPDP
jgi:transposase-like protein